MLELILLAALSADIAPPQMPALPPVCQCGPVCDCGSDCRCAVSQSVLVKQPARRLDAGQDLQAATKATSKPETAGPVFSYTDCPNGVCLSRPAKAQPAAKSAVYQGQGRARRGWYLGKNLGK